MGVLPLDRLVHEVRRLRLQRPEPQRQEGRRRAGRAELRPDPAQARELADGPRRDRGRHRRSPATTSWRTPTRSRSGSSSRRTDDRYYTTGVTYQADNQPTPTTIIGAGVDVSVLPIIGLVRPARLGRPRLRRDRRERGRPAERRHRRLRQLRHHPQRARPAVRGGRGLAAGRLRPHRRAPRDRRLRHEPRRAVRRARRLRARPPTGRTPAGKLLNTYVSETWERPDRTASPADVDGDPLVNPADQQVLPVGPDKGCLEGPLMGVQFGTYADRPGDRRRQLRRRRRRQLRLRRRLLRRRPRRHRSVRPDLRRRRRSRALGGRTTTSSHVDLAAKTDADGDPIYKVTREEDINIGNGDSFVPQIPPPACAGTLHQVDVAVRRRSAHCVRIRPGHADASGHPTTLSPAADIDQWRRPGHVAAGPIRQVRRLERRDDPTVAAGRSPTRGLRRVPVTSRPRPRPTTRPSSTSAARPTRAGPPAVRHQARRRSRTASRSSRCSTSSPTCRSRAASSPTTSTTSPSRPTRSPCSTARRPAWPFTPVGIYDFANRLVTTVETDYNGLFDVLLPSTNRINCPTPSGVCANLYRFVGNDPGVPGRLNLELQPAVPDHRGRVRGLRRASSSRPTRRRPRWA